MKGRIRNAVSFGLTATAGGVRRRIRLEAGCGLTEGSLREARTVEDFPAGNHERQSAGFPNRGPQVQVLSGAPLHRIARARAK